MDIAAFLHQVNNGFVLDFLSQFRLEKKQRKEDKKKLLAAAKEQEEMNKKREKMAVSLLKSRLWKQGEKKCASHFLQKIGLVRAKLE